MKFFMTRHYSTAQKIINSLESMIGTKLADLCNYDSTPHFISLTDKRHLSEILGDVLKAKLPDKVYDKYQTLHHKNKKKLRDVIRNKLFIILKNSTENLESIITSTSFVSDVYDINTYIEVGLPNEIFKNKKVLANALDDAISFVNKKLVGQLYYDIQTTSHTIELLERKLTP